MTKRKKRRILIWGKTYPELSNKYNETVCTAGCFEDGTPIRIYPVPFRLMEDIQKYRLYQWIEAPVWPSEDDSRPESYKIDPNRIELGSVIEPTPGWMERRKIIERDESWNYERAECLKEDERSSGRSLGLVSVGEVEDVYVKTRPEEDLIKHKETMRARGDQLDAFEVEVKRDLEFQRHRIRVKWRCGHPGDTSHCNGHDMAVIDWGLAQLVRKRGPEAGRKKVEHLADLETFELKFFLGNLRQHPTSFMIVGLWYPKREDKRKRSAPLFEN